MMMVLIWLMMVNNNLVGGAITILKHMSSSMGRTIPYIMENNVPNHQSVMVMLMVMISSHSVLFDI